jgi:hypothetical protein
MGTHDVMNGFAMQELKRIYSTTDGWKMSPERQGSGYDTLVRLERLHGGHRDLVKVLITLAVSSDTGLKFHRVTQFFVQFQNLLTKIRYHDCWAYCGLLQT